MTISEQKHALRKAVWQAQKALSEAQRSASDQCMVEQLLLAEPVKQASLVFLFLGVAPEPDTTVLAHALLRQGKRIAVPLCRARGEMEAREITDLDQLVPGKYQIPEPVESCPVLPPSAFDLVLVPGVCFGRAGGRLGRGGGYYDRWLRAYQGITIGLCRAQFLQDTLPMEPHDRPVQWIATETGVWPAVSSERDAPCGAQAQHGASVT